MSASVFGGPIPTDASVHLTLRVCWAGLVLKQAVGVSWGARTPLPLSGPNSAAIAVISARG